MKYDIETLKKEKVLINCKTKGEAFAVLSFFKAAGVKWSEGGEIEPTELFWDFGSNSCYGFFFKEHSNCQLDFLPIPDDKEGFTIIDAYDFIEYNTPRLYTAVEVLEIERKAFEAARERTFLMNLGITLLIFSSEQPV